MQGFRRVGWALIGAVDGLDRVCGNTDTFWVVVA